MDSRCTIRADHTHDTSNPIPSSPDQKYETDRSLPTHVTSSMSSHTIVVGSSSESNPIHCLKPQISLGKQVPQLLNGMDETTWGTRMTGPPFALYSPRSLTPPAPQTDPQPATPDIPYSQYSLATLFQRLTTYELTRASYTTPPFTLPKPLQYP